MFYRSWTIRDHQRGLLTRNGILTGWLEPGVHTEWFPGAATDVEVLDLDAGVAAWTPEREAVIPRGAVEKLEIAHHERGLVTIDGQPEACLEPGAYLVWKLRGDVRVERWDLRPLRSELPAAFRSRMGSDAFTEVVVQPHERALLRVDGVLEAVLEPGRHGLHPLERQVEVEVLDLREQQLAISGQDVMTADKVSLRINLLVTWRMVDPALSAQATTSLRDALYAEAQLAARRFVAGHKLDALLERRNEASSEMRAAVAARAAQWGVEVCSLDLKDAVLPGELKSIFNQVIEAEKRAAANVITRREETAATRSLANTARVLADNPTLMRLKELETLKELAGQVGEIKLIATPSELMSAVRVQ